MKRDSFQNINRSTLRIGLILSREIKIPILMLWLRNNGKSMSKLSMDPKVELAPNN